MANIYTYRLTCNLRILPWEKPYYEVSMSMKDKIIADFLEINDIAKNELAPKLN